MYVLGVSFFRASPIVFQLKPSKPCLNVTSNHETIHDNLQHGSYICIYIVHLYGANTCNVWTVGFVFCRTCDNIWSNYKSPHQSNNSKWKFICRSIPGNLKQSVQQATHTYTLPTKMSNTGSWYYKLEQGTIKCMANHFNCPNKLSQNYPRLAYIGSLINPRIPILVHVVKWSQVFPSTSCHHEFFPLHEWACALICGALPRARSFKQETHLTIAIRPTAGHTSGCQPSATWVEIEETITTWKGNTAGRPSRTKEKVSAYWIPSIFSHPGPCHQST